MKKTVLIILSATILLFLYACGGNTTSQTTTAETTTAPSETIEFTVEIDPDEKSLNDACFPFDEYIKLADISSIEVSVSEKKEITDEYVSKWISSCLTNLGYFTRDDAKTIVNNGDVVSIDFESTINSEEYSGGIQSDFCFLMDADAFVPDLEKALLGKNVGDTFDISVTYPDDYTVETLAGKTADFTVTVNYLGTPDTLNEENIGDLSDGKYTSADEYIAYITEALTVSAEMSYNNALSEAVWNQIIEKTEVIKLPAVDRMAYCNESIAYITAMSESQGYTYADFLEAQGYTESSFLEYLYNDISPEIITEELIFAAVCAKEGISSTMTDDEYAIQAKEYALYYGYDTVSDLESAFGKDAIKEMIAFNNATKQLADKITITNK